MTTQASTQPSPVAAAQLLAEDLSFMVEAITHFDKEASARGLKSKDGPADTHGEEPMN